MIKRFNQINENFQEFYEYRIFPFKAIGDLNEQDFMKVRRDGRKVFYVSPLGEILEAKSLYDLKYKTKKDPDSKYLLFTTDELVDKIRPIIKNIKEIKDNHKKKIELLYQQAFFYIQEDGDLKKEVNEMFAPKVFSKTQPIRREQSKTNVISIITKDRLGSRKIQDLSISDINYLGYHINTEENKIPEEYKIGGEYDGSEIVYVMMSSKDSGMGVF
jgi:hypothetical protein